VYSRPSARRLAGRPRRPGGARFIRLGERDRSPCRVAVRARPSSGVRRRGDRKHDAGRLRREKEIPGPASISRGARRATSGPTHGADEPNGPPVVSRARRRRDRGPAVKRASPSPSPGPDPNPVSPVPWVETIRRIFTARRGGGDGGGGAATRSRHTHNIIYAYLKTTRRRAGRMQGAAAPARQTLTSGPPELACNTKRTRTTAGRAARAVGGTADRKTRAHTRAHPHAHAHTHTLTHTHTHIPAARTRQAEAAALQL